ncbi:hypothetical protein PHLGIDRAFT_27185 [Phlebiopsis gigantea 11061_1 CR5-6]|uniref:C2 domain-containing protein n=1 Tax=Phlebiopsis gigantea (strain 11061_1 CR5-6) TaxID=745531 RepID=A0A0C3S858_PHLG1|nr:hypothetical protein PHLGIDRAFT_27185 [Phlebiopsis gigantea 11061_1 CR5-6]
MSTGLREIGTLIVVVLKARNLPNKRHIGKQDPYCLITVNGEKRRTKAIKRGGQHPEWDEEIRFTVFEDDTEPSAPLGPNGTPPPPPPKKEKGPPSIKGGKFMTVTCYADDVREPDFIGEAKVDLTEALTKGETDEWFTIMSKDKYSGEVYLELTFWSNEPVPLKKTVSKHKVKKQYGGPGSFVPSDGPAHSSSDNINDFASISDVLPPSLRPSSSMAKVDLYKAPYETNRSHNSVSSMDTLANDFGQLSVQRQQPQQPQQPPPRQSSPQPPLAPSSSGYLDPQPSQYSYDSYSPYTQNNADPYNYNRPVTPTSSSYQSYPPQNPLPTQPTTYYPPYETPARPSTAYQGAPSSGFVPIPTPSPASASPVGPVPTPTPSNFSAASQQYPSASGFLPPSTSYHSIPPQQHPVYQYQYSPQSAQIDQSQYAQPPQTMSAPSTMNGAGHHPLPVPPPPPPSVPPQYRQAIPPPPPQGEYNQGYAEQPHQGIPPPPPLTQQSAISPASGQGGSRPLPVPGANQVMRRRHSTIGMQQQPGIPQNFTGPQPPMDYPPYGHIPPPPPLSASSSMSAVQPRPPPAQLVTGSTLPYPPTHPSHQSSAVPGPPPLPPPRAPSRAQSQQSSVNQSSPVYVSHPSQMQSQLSPVYPQHTSHSQPHTPSGYSPQPGHQASPGYSQHSHGQHPQGQHPQGQLAQNQQQPSHSMYQHIPPPPPTSNYGGTTSHTMALAASSFHPGPLPVPPQVSSGQSHGYPVASGSWQ